jgi:hypothetical protein
METHRQRFLRKHGLPSDTSLSLNEISKLSGVPVKALEEIEKRGAGAWRTSLSSVRIKGTFEKNPNTTMYPRSARLTQQEWSRARIYSFVDKGKTYFTADNDIARKYKV